MTTENIVLGILLWSLALWALFGSRLQNAVRPTRVDMRATPDDDTPRITANAEWGGVFVKIGNTPHIICMSETEALAMPNVRDER